ncbi:MAG: Holliday junction resolvase RuvX [Vampirovibrio sp.]|nr:Holliday junction resolvase RuvX [Vampirovibrio sp.]
MQHQHRLPTNAPLLAIDYGKKRIGLAYCDASQTFVFGLPTLEQQSGNTKREQVLASLTQLIAEKAIAGVVLGLPVNMDGSLGFMAETVQAFQALLQFAHPTLPIYLLDERLTSKIAQQALQQQGIVPSRNKGLIDQQAAKQLLEDYLRSCQLQGFTQ